MQAFVFFIAIICTVAVAAICITIRIAFHLLVFVAGAAFFIFLIILVYRMV